MLVEMFDVDAAMLKDGATQRDAEHQLWQIEALELLCEIAEEGKPDPFDDCDPIEPTGGGQKVSSAPGDRRGVRDTRFPENGVSR
ncbi:MAG: hypothetical protein AB7O44_29190 [Hyphomicrobiaceae bacterium]